MSQPLLTSFRRYLQRRNFSGYTVRNYVRAIAEFRQAVDHALPAVTWAEVARFVERLQAEGLAAKTINCKLSAVRQFYEYVRNDHLPDLKNPVRKRDFLKEPKPLPRAASAEQLVSIWTQIRSVRDRALFLVLWRSGVRVSEAIGLELGDVDLRRYTVRIREGKNRRERVIYLSPDTMQALEAYLEQRGWPRAGQLLVSEKGPTQGCSLSIRGVQKRIERYARHAGVQISCHTLRHSLATQRLNQGVRLVVVQELLGHTTVMSTQRYARLANRRVREEYFEGMRKIVGITV
jgi:site-specific recombinase XerD